MRLFVSVILSIMLASSLPAQKFDNQALIPPMGWNSWNHFGCDINETIIRETADAMVSSGMKDAGYEYIVIDDCWQIDRDTQGNIIADPARFPSGMKALADYIHSKGLKFGLYSDAGTLTCQKRPGSRGYEFQDARTYAAWGVDYLKYDWCHHGKQNAEASYTLMRDALYKAGRPIVFSLCEWGSTEPWKWARDVGHLWRTTPDIVNCFDCSIPWHGIGVLQIIDLQADLRKYAGPGHWNDPNMLQIGNGELSPAQSRTHFSLWCMLSAPLMAGNDLREMDQATIDILTNKEVIAVGQDSLGIQAMLWKKEGDLEIWFKPLQHDAYAVCFMNLGTEPLALDFEFKNQIIEDSDFNTTWHLTRTDQIRDLWKHETIDTINESIRTTISGHDVFMIRIK